MSPKTYLRILRGGIIASLFIILCVFKDLLFPFITSKQLLFNIVMEFLLAIWLVFILRYPEYRPKKNFISYGLIFYFLAILASCFVSVDFNLSFWGDAERMLGFFHLAHFLVLYFISITVFRNWNDWRLFFQASIFVATIISLIGLFGAESYSTIGNTAYVSGYLIFSIYFTILLFFRSSSKLWRYLYILPLIPMIFEFKNMHTSGAIIGLTLSLLLMILLLGFSHVNKKIRRGSLILFIVAVIAIVGIFSQSQAVWFQNSFLKNLTSQKATFQTRLISWQAAFSDFNNHPIFGNGFGNYANTFDKYFDSKFYDYSTSDTYFDRAHNNLIEILSTTGLVGLVTYLSIFLAALYYLWQEFKLNGKRSGGDANGLNNIEIIIIVSLLSAYFIQNLAIFDSFSTFLGLMTILAFVYWLDFRRNHSALEESNSRLVIKSEGGELAALIGFVLIAYIFTNQFNIKPWKMFIATIDGYSSIASGNLVTGVNYYKDNLVGAPLERDSRTTLMNLVITNPALFSNLNAEKAQEILDYVVSLAKINVAYNPYDSMMQMQLAQILDTAARFNYRNIERFNFYSSQAMQAIEFSIESSPKRATIYFTKAQLQLMRMENDEAVATMKQGIVLNTNYYEGYCRLSQMYFILDDKKYESEKKFALDNCFDKGGLSSVSSSNLLKLAVNFYSDVKDFNKAAQVSERIANLSDNDPEAWYNLAQLYLIIGNDVKSEEAFQKAVALDPNLIKGWQAFKEAIQLNRKVVK